MTVETPMMAASPPSDSVIAGPPAPDLSNPSLSIIVISYNTREMTLACLASIARETRTAHEVIVVENASSDGSAEAIAEAFPEVVLIAESVNHGFARAHPIAVARARAPWLLLLNPDTVVLDGALDKLLAFARRTPDAGIWGGRTLYADGRLNPFSCWGRMTPWSVFCRTAGLSAIFPRSTVFNPESYGGWDRSSEREVDIVTGCLFLIRRTDWDRLGGFDNAFIMYGEEADLCLRARALGLRPRMTPEAVIVHHGGASDRVLADKNVRLLRAKVELAKRHFSPTTRRLGIATLRLWPLSRAVALGVAGRLTGSATAREKGRIWGQIWTRRKEWESGFGAVAATATATSGGSPREVPD
jgi:GT2 family glycosyltransferase